MENMISIYKESIKNLNECLLKILNEDLIKEITYFNNYYMGKIDGFEKPCKKLECYETLNNILVVYKNKYEERNI